MQGYSARNIWYMRTFYLTYRADAKLQPLVAEMGWSLNLVLLDRCKEASEREFYLRMTKKMGWTKNILIHHIENRTFEKTLLSQTNFDKALSEPVRHQAKLAVKDEYTFDFLDLGEEHSEREFEQALLVRIRAVFARDGRGVHLRRQPVPDRGGQLSSSSWTSSFTTGG